MERRLFLFAIGMILKAVMSVICIESLDRQQPSHGRRTHRLRMQNPLFGSG
jgi:hypothetical protein